MPPTVRRDYRIASYLYFATIVVYGLPGLYLALPEPLGAARHQGLDTRSMVIIVGTSVLLLGLFIWLGFGIRAGKTWAKALFLLFFAWMHYFLLRDISRVIHSSPLFICETLLTVLWQFSTAFFLFRSSFTRRPAAPVAEGLAE